MRPSIMASIVFLIAGIGLLFEWFQSMMAWEDYKYIGCVGFGAPPEPEPFIILGLLFMLLSASAMMYALMHRNDGRCPWCGQSIGEEVE